MTLAEYKREVEEELNRFCEFYMARHLADPQTYPTHAEFDAWEDFYMDWYYREE